jgi:hypothetical protein
LGLFFTGHFYAAPFDTLDGGPKFWVAGKLVDGDAKQAQSSLDKVRALMQAEPDLVVIPAYDSLVQAKLGYFPAWVR